MGKSDAEEPVTPVGDPVELGNEFAFVRTQKVETRNGPRLEITSPRLGYRIRLDPVQLEALTWQDEELFSGLLETPFGPELPGG